MTTARKRKSAALTLVTEVPAVRDRAPSPEKARASFYELLFQEANDASWWSTPILAAP